MYLKFDGSNDDSQKEPVFEVDFSSMNMKTRSYENLFFDDINPAPRICNWLNRLVGKKDDGQKSQLKESQKARLQKKRKLSDTQDSDTNKESKPKRFKGEKKSKQMRFKKIPPRKFVESRKLNTPTIRPFPRPRSRLSTAKKSIKSANIVSLDGSALQNVESSRRQMIAPKRRDSKKLHKVERVFRGREPKRERHSSPPVEGVRVKIEGLKSNKM